MFFETRKEKFSITWLYFFSLYKLGEKLFMSNENAVKNLIVYLSSYLNLSDEFYSTIGPMLKPADLREVLCIAKSGEICTDAYWIEEGYSRSFMKKIDKNGKEQDVTIGFSKSKNIFTIPECFFNNDVCKYNVQIAKGSVIVPFSRAHFNTLKFYAPEAEELATKIISRDKAEGLENALMLKMPPRMRYQEFLRIYGIEIEQFFALKHIASYLNMQPSYLSRLRSELLKKRT